MSSYRPCFGATRRGAATATRPAAAGPTSAGALALALALALTGCAASTAADPGAVGAPSSAGSLTVFAAASLDPAFTELLHQFAAAHPEVDVRPATFDGSATLTAQLEEGAQADVIATADAESMARLAAAGLTAREPQTFATNTLVIAVPSGNPLGIASLADFASATLAVCAAEVPCGRATTSLFDAAGVIASPVSYEQSVAAVAERVASGEVDGGIVYATDVASRSGALEAVVPPEAASVVSSYPIAAIASAGPQGQAFVDYVLSAAGQAVLAHAGFGAP